jgi:hypothetical protein
VANEPYKRDETERKERLSTADLADAGREERAVRFNDSSVHTGPVETESIESAPVESNDTRTVERAESLREDESLRQRERRADEQSAAPEVRTPPMPAGRTSNPGLRGAAAATATATAKEPETGPLFASEEASRFRQRWDAVQVGFVDEPRKSVEEADNLVAEAMKRLAEQFAEERSKLEGQWSQGSDVSTEDLRLALQRYRSFFGRLLSV